LLRVVRTVGAIAVERARANPGDVAVPHVVGMFGQRDARHFVGVIDGVEEGDDHLRRVFGEDGEVHALAVEGRPEREGLARPDAGGWRCHTFTSSGSATGKASSNRGTSGTSSPPVTSAVNVLSVKTSRRRTPFSSGGSRTVVPASAEERPAGASNKGVTSL